MKFPVNGAFFFAIIAIYWYYFEFCRYQDLPQFMGGYVDPRFKLVGETFRKNVNNGLEVGGAIAVYYEGELVVDMWGGYIDREVLIPWKNDTLGLVYSCSKGIGVILLGIFAEKGYIDFQERVSHYWPEFAQNGKESITIEMLINHQAGLHYLEEPLEMELFITDFDQFASKLALQKPHWTPGTQFGYHCFTFGMYVDVLLRKADPLKRPLEQIYREELFKPYDLDIFQGTPYSEQYRTVSVLTEKYWWEVVDSFFDIVPYIASRILFAPHICKASTALLFNQLTDSDTKLIPSTSVNAYSTARSLAKLYGNLANAGYNKGKDILSKSILNELTKVKLSGTDQVLLLERALGLGFMLHPLPKGGYMFGYAGFGGQVAYGEMTNRISIAHITNHLNPIISLNDERWSSIITAIYDSLEKIKKH
ncbi:beta-lactamase domain-containing protein 2-like isoform X1 [Octopus sinensis]|uniref:Beta-lactamase domain-containing protein 2-like isoform X1 n=1 Tax=Octopus sinensis TaxID=2607531 RepID=A0A6P7SEK3_9MOLL|nr:beta-lactamase domain-containing protein 2-like isoform X1 [Octopus sinensis]